MITDELQTRGRKYELIFSALKREIEAGNLVDGVALASEAQLCARFDVSRGPVRQALAELERRRLIKRVAGKGSFVLGGEVRQNSAPEPGVRQLVAVINTSGVRPANFIAFELVDGLNQATEEAGADFRLNFQFHRRGDDLGMLSVPPCHGMLVAPLTFAGVKAFSQLAEQRAQQMPLVSLYNRVDVPNVSQFFVEHEAGAMEATEFLLRFGHRRIAMLAEPAISPGPAAVDREAGFRKAVEAAGLTPATATIVNVGVDPAMQLANIEQLLRRPDRPSALVIAGGVITPSVLHAVRNLGLVIPDDLSIIAFDDTPEAAIHEPRLTVVRVPLRRVARMGVEWLVEQIEEREGRRGTVSMPVKAELILGRSCGPASR